MNFDGLNKKNSQNMIKQIYNNLLNKENIILLFLLLFFSILFINKYNNFVYGSNSKNDSYDNKMETNKIINSKKQDKNKKNNRNEDREKKQKDKLLKKNELELIDLKISQNRINKLKKQMENKRDIVLKRKKLKNINIYNGFHKNSCTWYVALKKFPFKTEYTQKKLWNGDAREWYRNSQKAGYTTIKQPKKGSIVVFKNYGYNKLGHVGIVRYVSKDGKYMIIKETQFEKGKLTIRMLHTDDRSIVGFINGNLK